MAAPEISKKDKVFTVRYVLGGTFPAPYFYFWLAFQSHW
jgi:hypothetical protein